MPPPGLVAIAISKGKLYEALRETGLVPRYQIVSRDELLERRGVDLDGGPVWLRDYSDASSSGIRSALPGRTSAPGALRARIARIPASGSTACTSG